MVGLLLTLVKAGLVFGLLAITVRMLRRYDRRVGTTTRRGHARSGSRTKKYGAGRGLGAALSGLGGRPERVLDVVERTPLGRTASAVLVRVRDQHFLLGVSDSRVTMLLEVDLPDEGDDDHDVERILDGAIDLRNDDDGAAGFAGRFGAELLRQARQHLPGSSRVELIDPPLLTEDRPAEDRPAEDGPAGDRGER
jgi:hypothetical protein